MAEEPQKLDYARPDPERPEPLQKSFALDLNAGRFLISCLILLLIFMACVVTLVMISRR